MRTVAEKGRSFKTGMYLLDSFTSGMYNDPLIIYREYIQNAVDSIDLNIHRVPKSPEVRIVLDPGKRIITIRDSASGIPGADAEEILNTIGSSTKNNRGLRGFRGIGRLGGIAFCDKAVFRTKSRYESVESIQEWDCKGLRSIQADQGKRPLLLEQVLGRITSFRQEPISETEESYFEVTMHGVSSFRNILFDIEKVRRYLSQITPVPFNCQEFSYGRAIDDFLSTRVKGYGSYTVVLNGEQVFKPYRDSVKITKGEDDRIDGIEFLEIFNGKRKPIAYGWYARRRELLGSIVKGDDSFGVRVRVGNIQIGDAHLLDFCFREPRFNSYIPGEVHVDSEKLIPNSRRDDFVDNQEKGLFYNSIERQVGLPISKEIRLRSRMVSNQRISIASLGKEAAIGDLNRQPKSCEESIFPSPRETANEKTGISKSASREQLNQAAALANNSLALTLPDSAPEIIESICYQCPNLSKLLGALKCQKPKRRC